MYPKEIVEPALKGSIHFEFTEVILERKGSNGADAVNGTGYVEQNGDYFEFVFFHNGKLSHPFYYMRHYMQDGLIIKEDCFFTAHCRTYEGRSWTIDDVLPDADTGPGGVVVHARVREIRWNELLPRDIGAQVVTLYVLGSHDFPPNEFKKTQIVTGDGKPLIESRFSVAKVIGIPKVELSIERFEDYSTLSASSSRSTLSK